MYKRAIIVMVGAVIGCITALALTAFVKANAADNPAKLHEATKVVAAVNLERVDEDETASDQLIDQEPVVEGYTGPVAGELFHSDYMTVEDILEAGDGGDIEIVMSQADPTKGILFYRYGYTAGGHDYLELFRTVDGGMSWYRLSTGYIAFTKCAGDFMLYENTIAVSTFTPWSLEGVVELSSDLGLTFYRYSACDLLPANSFQHLSEYQYVSPCFVALEDDTHFILAFNVLEPNDGWELTQENIFVGRYQLEPNGDIRLLEDLTETEGL